MQKKDITNDQADLSSEKKNDIAKKKRSDFFHTEDLA